MPPVSQAQRGAMAAAAAGNSNVGIPASVGKDFMAADKGGKLPERKKKPGTRSSRMYKSKGIAGQKRMQAAAAEAAQAMPPGVPNG